MGSTSTKDNGRIDFTPDGNGRMARSSTGSIAELTHCLRHLGRGRLSLGTANTRDKMCGRVRLTIEQGDYARAGPEESSLESGDMEAAARCSGGRPCSGLALQLWALLCCHPLPSVPLTCPFPLPLEPNFRRKLNELSNFCGQGRAGLVGLSLGRRTWLVGAGRPLARGTGPAGETGSTMQAPRGAEPSGGRA